MLNIGIDKLLNETSIYASIVVSLYSLIFSRTSETI